jgi:hypothetical protein
MSMQTSKKKLVIKKEAVRELSDADVQDIAGGANSMQNGCSYRSAAIKCIVQTKEA